MPVTKFTHIINRWYNYCTLQLETFESPRHTNSYLRSRLWNTLVNDFPFSCHIDYNGFEEFIKDWTSPNLDDGFNYVYYNTIFIHCYLSNIYICHFTCPESLKKIFTFYVYHIVFLLYSILVYILCCTVHMLHPLSYTSLLANVVCFTYDLKWRLFYPTVVFSLFHEFFILIISPLIPSVTKKHNVSVLSHMLIELYKKHTKIDEVSTIAPTIHRNARMYE